MHVALLANAAWLDEALPLFGHLTVGLLDEQVRVAQVVPEGRLAGDVSVFGELVTWPASRRDWINRRKIAALDEVLGGLGVDVLHVLDGRLWSAARQLGARMEVPVVYSCWSGADLRRLPGLAGLTGPDRAVFTAATDPLLNAMRQTLPERFTVHPLHPGVHTPAPPGSFPCATDPGSGSQTPEVGPDARDGSDHTGGVPAGLPVAPGRAGETSGVETSSGGQPVMPGRAGETSSGGGGGGVVVAGDGRLDRCYQALLDGLVLLVRHNPEVQVFFDGQQTDQRDLWRAAQRLGLMNHCSFVPRRLGHRDLLLEADLLVHPQPQGLARGLTLRAMARGTPVLAHHDPVLDYLIDGTTAQVLTDPSAADWHHAIEAWLHHPQRARTLCEKARQWVGQHRLASMSVAQALHAYHIPPPTPGSFPPRDRA